MYKSFFGMEFNPFSKGLESKLCFRSEDFSQASSRLEHLKSMKGIGLFTGLAGTGKTFSLRCFADSLNPNLHKLVYIPLSTVSVPEFYKAIAYGLQCEVPFRKIDLFRVIQERIVSLSKDKNLTPVIIIDEAQYLRTDILNDLKILLNFDMDSKNHAILILSGQPMLNHILSKQVHEPLKQRIVISYNFLGITKPEVLDYISSRMKLCGVQTQVFNPESIEALFACSGGSVRKLNSLVERCLLIACQRNLQTVNTDIVMLAQNESELM